jgi:hypothetical protein
MNRQVTPGCLLYVVLLLIGGFCAYLGIHILTLAFGNSQIPAGSFHAPRLATTGVGLLFLLPGAWMMIRALLGNTNLNRPVIRWGNYLFVLALLLNLSALFLWGGFTPSPGDPLARRIVTSGIGLLSALLLLWYAVVKWPPRGKA